MKKQIIIPLFLMLAMAACKKDNNTNSYKEVTVDMESNQGSDVYYSMANGAVNTVDRNDWDIAFSVPLQTATILINEGKGLELYCVGDTNAWGSVSANSITGLKSRLNNKSDWTIGAFNQYSNAWYNYGWGTYHKDGDHNVGGDSIYIIKFPDQSLMKLMIRAKLGANSGNIIRTADADGSNEFIDTLVTAPYNDLKNFIHYSLVNHQAVEAEPKMDEWDLLFTRYVALVQFGPGPLTPYSVMGVLLNPNVTVAKVTGVPAEKAVDTQSQDGYVATADVIGWDSWKKNDQVTHETSIADSVSFFIKSVDGKKYQLYFTGYDGQETGTMTFKVKTVE
jgi:hypothetical protein